MQKETLYQIKRSPDFVSFFFLIPGHDSEEVDIRYTKEYLKVSVEDSFHDTGWGSGSETVIVLGARDNERLDFSKMEANNTNGILVIDVPIKPEWQEKVLEITEVEEDNLDN